MAPLNDVSLCCCWHLFLYNQKPIRSEVMNCWPVKLERSWVMLEKDKVSTSRTAGFLEHLTKSVPQPKSSAPVTYGWSSVILTLLLGTAESLKWQVGIEGNTTKGACMQWSYSSCWWKEPCTKFHVAWHDHLLNDGFQSFVLMDFFYQQ